MKYRVEWAKFQERERKKEEEEREKERVAYAQIDWHDFVVVETVDFQPNEQGNLSLTTIKHVTSKMDLELLIYYLHYPRPLPPTYHTRRARRSHPDPRAL